jgi:hypothetical protein
MHVLLAASETFGNAIILSPSLGLGEGVLFEQEADYAADHDDLPAQAYLSAGELEAHGLAGMTQEMGRILAGRGHPSMRVRTELVPRTVHADVFPIAAEDGLRFVLGER